MSDQSFDRIPETLRVARPAMKLDTDQDASPCLSGPESSVLRSGPASPLQRVQEIAMFDISDAAKREALLLHLNSLSEEELIQIKGVLSTLREGDNIGDINARAVWRLFEI